MLLQKIIVIILFITCTIYIVRMLYKNFLSGEKQSHCNKCAGSLQKAQTDLNPKK